MVECLLSRRFDRETKTLKIEGCIQCGNCSVVCPHAAIRLKLYGADYLASAPAAFKSAPAKGKDLTGSRFTVQVAPEDCTGCTLCISICPARVKVDGVKTARKALSLATQALVRKQETSDPPYSIGDWMQNYTKDKQTGPKFRK